MSHFSYMPTRMSNKEILKQALKQQPEVRDVKENWFIRGYSGTKVKGDVVGVLEGQYDIGFVFKDECFAIADFSFGTCGGGNKNLVDLWQRIVATYLTLDTYEQANKQKGLSGTNIKVTIH